MNLRERIDVFVLKSRHAFLNQSYETVVESVRTVLALSGRYFNQLPNYFQFSQKAQFVLFVSDGLAFEAVAHLLLHQSDYALECIDKAIEYIPDGFYYIIRSAVLTESGDFEAAIQTLKRGCYLVNRTFLGNDCGITAYQLEVYKLVVSIATQDHQRTYYALANVLSRKNLQAAEYLAAEECMRLASEQFHQVPIYLKAHTQLAYPGISHGNYLVDLQRLQYYCYQYYYSLGGELDLPGVQMPSHIIVSTYLPNLRTFMLAPLGSYLNVQVFKPQFFAAHARISRRFMGMVKLSGNKQIRSDYPVLTEEALRRYMWDTVVSKEIAATSLSRSHSLNSKSSSQSFSQINQQNERAAQEMRRRQQAFLQPLQLFASEERLQASQFDNTANIRALTTKDSGMLRPQFHLNKTQNKTEFMLGNGAFRTTTSIIDKTKPDTSIQSVYKLHDRLPSNELFQRVRNREVAASPASNKHYSCDSCRKKARSTVHNMSKYEVFDCLQRADDSAADYIDANAQDSGQIENVFLKFDIPLQSHAERTVKAERIRRVRQLQLRLQNDPLLQSYKSRLAKSQLLATNYEDFQNVLYVHDRPRPQPPTYDADFNDLFSTKHASIKSILFKRPNLNAANVPRLDLMSKLHTLGENVRHGETQYETDAALEGRELLDNLKVFSAGQLSMLYDRQKDAYDQPRQRAAKYPQQIITTSLKMQFDLAVQQNQRLFSQRKQRAPNRKQHHFVYEDEAAFAQQKYFRTNKTSFLFGVQ